LYNSKESAIQVSYQDCDTRNFESFSLGSMQTQSVCSCIEPETIPQDEEFLEILSESPCEIE